MRRMGIGLCALAAGFGFTVVSAGAAAAGSTIVVTPGHSIQAAVDKAHPGDTVLVEPGVYHQSVQIRTDGITLRGSGEDPRDGTVLVPPKTAPKNLCTRAFGPNGVCVLAKGVNPKTGAVTDPVYNDTITDLYITGFSGDGVFGYGTYGLTVTNVAAIDNWYYGISRFDSTKTLFADDVAVGATEAGFYVGDSPDADTVVRDDQAYGNEFGIFVRHAHGVLVEGNTVTGNCAGILLLDDGQAGGMGNTQVRDNSVFHNNKFCKAGEETPVNVKGSGIVLIGATESAVVDNSVGGNSGKQPFSGGIVITSAAPFHGSNPNYDTIADNTAYRDHPADVLWDGTGVGDHFRHNHCRTSMPAWIC